MTATEFRRKLYGVLAELSESGKSITITHRKRLFRIEPVDQSGIMDRLVPHDTLKVPADELVAGLDVLATWHEGEHLDGSS